MANPTRVRRTPEEAKQLILEAAQQRLIEFGIRGLTIKDVAADTNINHGTLLHHFGSAEGMRIALLSKMTGELIEDMSKLLASEPTTGGSIVRLFELMNSTGHIKLLAWRAMEDGLDPDPKMQSMGSLQSIIDQITAELSDHDQVRARNMVFFAVSTAIGWGICGNSFQKVFGLTPTQQEAFPRWVGEQINRLTVTDSD
jgi:AcrR family transcriptional regulator